MHDVHHAGAVMATKYAVHVQVDWIYEIEADSPEDAAAQWEDEPPPLHEGECTGYSIDAVTSPGDDAGDDLRAPVPCRGGCGKQLPASRNDECIDCFMARLKREREKTLSDVTSEASRV